MKLLVKILLFVLVALITNVKVMSAAITFPNIQEATTSFSFHTEIPKTVFKISGNGLENCCQNGSDLVDYRNWAASTARKAAKTGIEVTEASIAKALEGSTMQTLQVKVSLPMVQRYVKMLESGSVAPPIKVANGIIVEGNHRYVAGRLFGIEPVQVPYVVL